jgi:hypothetical protein
MNIKRTVILSTNDEENYINYLPYIQKAWNILGWNTLTFYLGEKKIKSEDINLIINLNSITGIRDATVVQVSRLFAHKYIDGLIMTSDVDMMPLSNYWNPDPDKLTCYGKDLTNNIHYPICYISAPKKIWDEIIYEDSIEELLLKYNQCKSNEFSDWWFTDQDIITERLLPYEKNEVPRGFENGLAYGRIDRDNWKYTKDFSKSQKIDAHMPRPFNEFEANDLINKYLIKYSS